MLLALLSCSLPSPEARVREAVLRALADEQAPVEDRLGWCAQASDPDVQGDCMLGVVDGALRADPASGETLCPRLPAGPWRWECRFVQAEAWYHAHDEGAAARACQQAGDFAEACGQHLYQAPVRITVGEAGVDGWTTSLPAVRALEADWSERLGPDIAVHGRLWSAFYQVSFRRSPYAPRTACDTVPATERDLCRQLWDEVRAEGPHPRDNTRP